MSCRCKDCQFSDKHTTRSHKCGVCGEYGHGAVECGNPKAIDFVLTTPAEDATSHGIQGINDGANFLLDKNILDREIAIKTDDAVEYMHKLATDKGLMVGISSAANILASKKWLEDNPDKGNVITMICDRGERYLDMTKENHHE